MQNASRLISVVESWDASREAQREGRLVRIGSPHGSVHHHIVQPQVQIEHRKNETLNLKAQLAQEFMNQVRVNMAARKGH